MGHYETPDYKVIMSHNNFEIRKYKLFFIVEYDNQSDPNITGGFGTLFNYIGRNNFSNQKIKMTIPVIEEIESNKLKMAFVLPKKYWDDAPVPKSEFLKIQHFEEGFYAVVGYGGRSNTKIETNQTELLREWIKSNQWEITSRFMLAFYNPPFIPGIFRRNEIMVRINDIS